MNIDKPNIEVISKPSQLSKALKTLSLYKDALGSDTETTGLDPLNGARVRLLSMATPEVCYVIDTWRMAKKINDLKNFLVDKNNKFIFHNAKFDIKMLKKSFDIPRFNKIYCTFIGSQLLSFGKVEYGHSLKEVVSTVFNVELDKSYQMSDWGADNLSDAQLQYSAEDSMYLIPLRAYQIDQLRLNGMMDVATIEMRAIEVFIEMELNGIYMDYAAWVGTANRNKSRVMRMHLKISKILSPQNTLFAGVTGFKVSSDKQLKDYMKMAGIELPTKWDRKKGLSKETIEMDYLEKIKDSHPVIPLMIKCSGLEKSVSSYGENWKERIHPVTGRIHTDFKQIGALTGRVSCNLHQVPRESLYRKRFKAPKGRKIVAADYSQMELRILAFLSQDRNMIRAFQENKDIHTHTASLVYKVAYDMVDKKIQRARAKNLNFGIVFGIGPDRFARNAEIKKEEAEALIRLFFDAYPDVEGWLTWARKEARYRRRSVTLANRLVKYRFNPEEKWQVSAAERNGMNTPIQGSNADILKLAMRDVYEDPVSDTDIMIHNVHDELLKECDEDEAEEVGARMKKHMTNTALKYITNVPIVVDVSISDCWGK